MQVRTCFAIAVMVTLLLAAPAAQACSVCWGAPDDPLVKGANNGVWVLLAIVGLVQIGFLALFYSFWRRSREHQRFRESFRVIHPFDRPLLDRSGEQGGPQS